MHFMRASGRLCWLFLLAAVASAEEEVYEVDVSSGGCDAISSCDDVKQTCNLESTPYESTDACIVVVQNSQFSDCRAFCEAAGSTCLDGWDSHGGSCDNIDQADDTWPQGCGGDNCGDDCICMCASTVTDEQTCGSNLGNLGGFSACYILWPLQLGLMYLAIVGLRRKIQSVGSSDEARAEWGNKKRLSFFIYVVCSIMHFAAGAWLGWPWVGIFVGPCFVLGVIVPILICKHGDKILSTAGSIHVADSHRVQSRETRQHGEQCATDVELAPVADVEIAPLAFIATATVLSTNCSTKCDAGTAAGDPPPLAEMVEVLKRELVLAGTFVEVVDEACTQLDVPREGNLVERARACVRTLNGS